LLAAVFGILSAILIFAFLKSNGGSTTKVNDAINAGAGAESVVVLTQTVNAGDKIESYMLTTKTVPVAGLVDGHSTKTEDFVGKVAVQTMFAGEQVITPKVTSFEGSATLAYQVPEGKRALGMMVPHEAWIIGGLPQPGDRVDVIGITAGKKVDPLTGVEKPELLSGIIAQDVEVLAVGQTLVKGVPSSDGKTTVVATAPGTGGEEAKADGDTRETVISVTLALTPEQAAKVSMIDAMRDEDGQWRIIARRKGETDAIAGQLTWTLDDVFAFKK
jgi:Flp pilus assembly protein CpaB